jgi:hypothetical protein
VRGHSRAIHGRGFNCQTATRFVFATVIASEAKQSSLASLLPHGLLRFARNDGRYSFAFSRREAPELCKCSTLEKSEGAGKAGCPLHPQPRVVCKKHAS